MASQPKLLQTHLKAISEEQELLLFTSYDHGKLLTIYDIFQKAKVYIIGNPLIAATMTRHDIGAALLCASSSVSL